MPRPHTGQLNIEDLLEWFMLDWNNRCEIVTAVYRYALQSTYLHERVGTLAGQRLHCSPQVSVSQTCVEALHSGVRHFTAQQCH